MEALVSEILSGGDVDLLFFAPTFGNEQFPERPLALPTIMVVAP